MTTATKKEKVTERQSYILVSGTYARRVGSGEDRQLRIWQAGEEIELTASEAKGMRDKLMTPKRFAAEVEKFEEQVTEQKETAEGKEELEEDAKGDPAFRARRRVIDHMRDAETAKRRIM